MPGANAHDRSGGPAPIHDSKPIAAPFYCSPAGREYLAALEDFFKICWRPTRMHRERHVKSLTPARDAASFADIESGGRWAALGEAYPVTARSMAEKEKRRYRRWKVR